MTALIWLRDRFELARHGDAENLASMEGMRGFAVFLVFVVHFAALAVPWVPSGSISASILGGFEAIGHSGVDLFFVLSGYLIYGALIDRHRPFLPYFRRRLQRIYPTFLAVFALYLMLSALLPEQSKLPDGAVAAVKYVIVNLLLLPGIFPFEPMITVAWSLSYELFYYLSIPLVIGVLRLRSWTRGQRVMFFGAMAVSTLVLCAAYTGPVRLVMFLAGVLLWEARSAAKPTRINDLLVAVALVFAAFVLVTRPDGSVSYAIRAAFLFVSFYVLCVACFGGSAPRFSAVLSFTPLRWLGNMSYSYYLIHGLALKAMFLMLGRVLEAGPLSSLVLMSLFCVGFLLTLVPSTFLFLAVERPFSLDAGRRKAAAVAPA